MARGCLLVRVASGTFCQEGQLPENVTLLNNSPRDRTPEATPASTTSPILNGGYRGFDVYPKYSGASPVEHVALPRAANLLSLVGQAAKRRVNDEFAIEVEQRFGSDPGAEPEHRSIADVAHPDSPVARSLSRTHNTIISFGGPAEANGLADVATQGLLGQCRSFCLMALCSGEAGNRAPCRPRTQERIFWVSFVGSVTPQQAAKLC